MQDFQSFLAPAKINLFLHIVGVRADGYHLLQSVFRLIDHYDTLYLKVSNNTTIKRIALPNNVSDANPSATNNNQQHAHIPEAQDLCIRAAKLLQQHTGCQLGVDIAIDKRIAMGAGLGGGSSDAATVLLALNRLWKLNLSRAELLALGLSLGADVPFFIFGESAWVEGIGEDLQAITLNDACYVILNPQIHVSTAQIFANKQLTKDAIPMKMSDFSRASYLSDNKPVANKEVAAHLNVRSEFINHLEKVVCTEYPAVLDCLNWLKQFGDARMSGSGASVFLEVANAEVAASILNQKPNNMQGFIAKGLNQHPLKTYAD